MALAALASAPEKARLLVLLGLLWLHFRECTGHRDKFRWHHHHRHRILLGANLGKRRDGQGADWLDVS